MTSAPEMLFDSRILRRTELKDRGWAETKRLAVALPIFGVVFLGLTMNAQAAPGNDEFFAATPLSGPPLSVEFDDNKGATKQSGEPSHAGNVGGHSVWYSWTPSVGAHVVVSTCTISPGIDTLLAVYTGSAVNSLTPGASNDERAEDRCNSIDSEVEFTAGALRLIAERALKRDTGARALRAVCEEIMLDLMYKLPDVQQGGKYIIDEAICEGRRNLFELKPERRRESA